MPNVWGYVRVSDELQVGKKTLIDGRWLDASSPETQKHLIRQWWEQNKHLFPKHKLNHIFEDPAQSAMKTPLAQRPQGRILMSYLQPGDMIIAADQERVFRSLTDFANTVHTLQRDNVRLICLDNPTLDYTTSDGEMLAGIKAVIKQYEARAISRRMKTAYHSKVERGIVTGDFCPLGWKKAVKFDGKKAVKYFVPDEFERWWLRIFRWMYINDRKEWKRDDFREFLRTYRFVHRSTGKRYWRWCYFRLADFVVTNLYPLQQLTTVSQKIVHELVSYPDVRVPQSPARTVRTPKPKPPSNWASLLWHAPPGVKGAALRRVLYQEPDAPVQEAESPPPDASPGPSR